MINIERRFGEIEITGWKYRPEAFDRLIQQTASFQITDAFDPSRACDEWVDLLLQYETDELPKIFDTSHEFWKTTATYHKRQWEQHGFSDPSIRTPILDYLAYTGLFTDPSVKMLLSAQCHIDIPEVESLLFQFADLVSPGAFQSQEDTQQFILFLADQSHEMGSKRCIDWAIAKMLYISNVPKETVAQFVNSPEGYRLATYSTISWLSHDDAYLPTAGFYKELARDAFAQTRETDDYRQFVADGVDGIIRRFHGVI